jgi:hypothetical protein
MKILSLLVLPVALLAAGHTDVGAQTRIAPNTEVGTPQAQLIKRNAVRIGQQTVPVQPFNRSGSQTFALRNENGWVAVTFGECTGAANTSCTYGTGSVDHDETTGSCSFSCLSAP